MKTIAIIGTGIMGAGMARNFLLKGFSVVVWNRTKENASELIKLGATWADTPKLATQKADLVFEITSNDESSKSVWLGDDGILAGADRKKFLVVSGTMSVKWVEELAGMCAGKGFSFFDIPLTGGRAGAESGQLILLAGGNKNLLDGLEE